MPSPRLHPVVPVEAPLSVDDKSNEQLSAPGFRAFLTIADRWRLTVEQRCRLLGGVPPATYHHWKSNGAPAFPRDRLERLSLILGIWKGLRLLFKDDAGAERWLSSANTDLPFAGDSPLATMLRGSINDLYAVRRYIDGWRGVWP